VTDLQKVSFFFFFFFFEFLLFLNFQTNLVVDCPIRDLECLRQVPMNKLAFFRPPVLFAGMDHIIGDILSVLLLNFEF